MDGEDVMTATQQLCLLGMMVGTTAMAGDIATYAVRSQNQGSFYEATGTVTALRQGALGAQVSGRISDVLVRCGQTVSKGQPLIHIDVGDSKDTAIASRATASGAAARLVSARADFERAQRLRAQEYISVAAMQRAEANLKSAQAEASASAAQASAAQTRAGWYTVTAPYAGHITDLWVSAGDMAIPGKPLLTLIDPTAFRAVAQVPESLVARIQSGKVAYMRVGDAAPVAISNWRVVPAIDPNTHSAEVRVELSAGAALEHGQFVRLSLPLADATSQLRIPLSAVLHRSEVVAVYVVDTQGVPHLRQVRLGPTMGDSVSVLAGLQDGERVALDPVAAGSH